nr:class I tRNA ligase family protein [Lachnospiraceae bacterium]
LIKQQWFVRMGELIKPAVEAVKNREVELIPERMEKIYYNWTDNIKDWCISRQLWWGHRIPAYYCDDCGEITVAKTPDAPKVCPKCGSARLHQDEDTLDTWFSSALWPFSTLGWPEQTKDLEYFYPTSVLVTGYDIIFFWVIRMIFSGYEHTGKKPFKTVLFHGLVRDSQGRKMSKSLGNGIDPLEVIDKYGADALRFTLITGNAPGNDMRFYWERVEASRNFANKVWNASRFIMMNMAQMKEQGLDAAVHAGNLEELEQVLKQASGCTPSAGNPETGKDGVLTSADRWILSKANDLVREVTDNLEHYERGIAADKIYDFIWEEFCDWYIEMVKPRLYGEETTTKLAAIWTLREVLTTALKLLHPYMPFVTEEIFCTLKEAEGTLAENESIMVSAWPKYSEERHFAEEEEAVELMKEAVKAIRNVRTEMNVPPSRKATVYIVSESEKVHGIFTAGKVFFAPLAYAGEVKIQADKAGIDDDAVSAVIHQASIYMPFADLVDIAKEIERLNKEKTRLEGEIKRANGMLSNPNFVNKAPEKKLAEEKEKLAKYTDMLAQVEERLAHLSR